MTYDELIERLRARVKIETSCGNRTENPNNHVRLMDEAADALATLQSDRERMRKALEACRQWFMGYAANSGTGAAVEEIALIDAALTATDKPTSLD